jgi:electron transport complex protein RnfC
MPEDTAKIVNGGPMMGKALSWPEAPLTKGSWGILLLPLEMTEKHEMQNCIRCGKCASACPMRLTPYLLMNLVINQMWERAEEERVMDCIECGSCGYACPSYRPLLDYDRIGKAAVNKMIRERASA